MQKETKKINWKKGLVASIEGLALKDLGTQAYMGSGFINIVYTGKQRMLNCVMQLKDTEEKFSLRLPLEAINRAMTFIKKESGPINYNSKIKKRWRFKIKQ